ncbi:MAG: type II toxin-antitoxin system VapC family toxin [Candidatus Hydrogenedentes bacterium]|nr:type II toxin-antitoxin system VapC family toxin [Candidatus Hydrogenedentota bacterium]
MNALDTNVFVRLITDDDPAMRNKAVQLVAAAEKNGEALLIPIPVLLEAMWVLNSRYEFSRTEILDALEQILLVKGLRFEAPGRVRELIRMGRSTASDLADILIGLCGRDLGCETTFTFDKKAAKSILFKRIH